MDFCPGKLIPGKDMLLQAILLYLYFEFLSSFLVNLFLICAICRLYLAKTSPDNFVAGGYNDKGKGICFFDLRF